jgi:hypothetical protein
MKPLTEKELEEMTGSNIQIYVILVQSKEGEIWVVGTPTRRGFTESGLNRALENIKLPKDWKAWGETIAPSYLFKS